MGMQETTAILHGIHLRNPEDFLRENPDAAKQLLHDLIPFVNDSDVKGVLKEAPQIYTALQDIEPSGAVYSIAVLIGKSMSEQSYLIHVGLVKAHQIRELKETSVMQEWVMWEKRMHDYGRILLGMNI